MCFLRQQELVSEHESRLAERDAEIAAAQAEVAALEGSLAREQEISWDLKAQRQALQQQLEELQSEEVSNDEMEAVRAEKDDISAELELVQVTSNHHNDHIMSTSPPPWV